MVAPRLQFDREVCAVCGKDTADRHFMRVYLEPGHLDFCTPACAQVFNDEPARFGVPPRRDEFSGWNDARWRSDERA